MRSLHLLDTDAIAGTERHVLLLGTSLDKLEVEVTIGCRTGGLLEDAARRQRIAAIGLGRRPGLAMFMCLLNYVRAGKADLLHAHNGRTLLMAALVHSLTGIPVVATQHFLAPRFTTYRGPKRWIARRAHCFVNRQIERFIAVSEAARAAMIERERLDPSQITTIRNGIASPDPRSLMEVDAVRTGLGIPLGAVLVVCVARLEAEKEIGTLVEAMRLVTVSNVRCVILGEGAERARLENQIGHLKLGGVVKLAGFRKDPLAVIRAADLMVLPSKAEPFGLVLLEAMALGKAVISTRAGGPIEIVVEGQTGQLVPPEDPTALAAAINALASNELIRSRMGAAGQSRFRSDFTADRMAASTAQVYASVLRRSLRSAAK